MTLVNTVNIFKWLFSKLTQKIKSKENTAQRQREKQIGNECIKKMKVQVTVTELEQSIMLEVPVERRERTRQSTW